MTWTLCLCYVASQTSLKSVKNSWALPFIKIGSVVQKPLSRDMDTLFSSSARVSTIYCWTVEDFSASKKQRE